MGIGGGATPALAQAVFGVSVSPHATAASRLPSNGTTYTVTFSVTDTTTGTDSVTYDLLTSQRPGSVLTTVSITGTGVTQGPNPDSAQVRLPIAGAVVVTVTYSVGNVSAGSIDTLVFLARAVPNPATLDSAKLVVTVTRPSLTVVKSVNPGGTQLPGANLTYTTTITNTGTESAEGVVHVDSVPAQIGFEVGSVSTTLPGGVTGTVAYSSDGTTWAYGPVSGGCGAPAGFDYCVRAIRLSLGNPLSHVGPNNTVQLVFVAKVK